MSEYRLSVVDEEHKEIYLIGFFSNPKELFQWVKSNWKELSREKIEMEGGKKTMNEKGINHVQVYRCNWCGKPILDKPTSLRTVENITILCSDCLDWRRDGKNILLTNVSMMNEGKR